MGLYSFIAGVVLISLSGVIAPGPLLAATLAEGKRNPFSGIAISFGHAAVEIPIIIGLFLFGTLAFIDGIKMYISIAGGFVFLYMAYNETRSKGEPAPSKGFVTGIAMSSLNPYFIIWWLTIGFSLIIESATFGLIGLLLFIIAHEACDFAWLGGVSMATFYSSKTFGPKIEKTLSAVSVTMLAVFGVYFIVSGIGMI